MNYNILNYYSIIHFIIYFILALFYPNKWIFVIIISILWEILEILLNYRKSKLWNETKLNKITDVIINLLGYGVGHLIQLH
jgi:hypothetical protein